MTAAIGRCFSYSIQNEKLLYWHYNDAKWWSEGKISDEKFQKSLIVLLESNTDLSQNNSEDLSIPTWFSNSAQWFSENKNESKTDIFLDAILNGANPITGEPSPLAGGSV